MQQGTNRDLVYCLRILESIGKISLYSTEFSEPLTFFNANNQKDFNACLLLLMNIGEQSARMSQETKQKFPQIEWRKIKEFRNFIAHDYVGVDKFIVFNVIKNDILILQNDIELLIAEQLNIQIFDKEEFEISKSSNYYQHISFDKIIFET